MDEQIRIALVLKNELKDKDKLNVMFSGIDGINFGDNPEVNCLGCGGNGYIFEVKASNGKYYVIKIRNEVFENSKELEEQNNLLMEQSNILSGTIKTLKPLGCGIVELNGLNLLYQITKSVDKDLSKHGALSLGKMFYVAQKAFEALASLHSKGYIHRDIKAENILLDPENNKVKLIDFDTVEEFPFGIKELVGTLNYMPQEIYLAYLFYKTSGNITKVDTSIDTYAFGLLLYEMLTGDRRLGEINAECGRKLIDGTCTFKDIENTNKEIINHFMNHGIQNLKQNINNETMSNLIINLIGRMIGKDPGKRPEDREVLGILTYFRHMARVKEFSTREKEFIKNNSGINIGEDNNIIDLENFQELNDLYGANIDFNRPVGHNYSNPNNGKDCKKGRKNTKSVKYGQGGNGGCCLIC